VFLEPDDVVVQAGMAVVMVAYSTCKTTAAVLAVSIPIDNMAAIDTRYLPANDWRERVRSMGRPLASVAKIDYKEVAWMPVMGKRKLGMVTIHVSVHDFPVTCRRCGQKMPLGFLTSSAMSRLMAVWSHCVTRRARRSRCAHR
jgi:hypothetical protein